MAEPFYPNYHIKLMATVVKTESLTDGKRCSHNFFIGPNQHLKRAFP